MNMNHYGFWKVSTLNDSGDRQFLNYYQGYIDYIALVLASKYNYLIFEYIEPVSLTYSSGEIAYEANIHVDNVLEDQYEAVSNLMIGRECMAEVVKTDDPYTVRICRKLSEKEKAQREFNKLIEENFTESDKDRLFELLGKVYDEK